VNEFDCREYFHARETNYEFIATSQFTITIHDPLCGIMLLTTAVTLSRCNNFCAINGSASTATLQTADITSQVSSRPSRLFA